MADCMVFFFYILFLSVPLQVKVEFFNRERGEWVKTLYTIQREDLCTAFFNPSEIWHSFVKDIPDDQRTCPYKKGVSIANTQ